MRGALSWILAGVGIIAVIAVTAAIGGRDESGETVPAGEWAQSVCGAVGVWRGELEAIVEDVRDARTRRPRRAARSRSRRPRRDERDSFARASSAPSGDRDARRGNRQRGRPRHAGWRGGGRAGVRLGRVAQEELEESEDALEDEAETLEEAIEQLTDAARTIGAVLASGAQTIVEISRLDPELAAALSDASTCEELREETGE